MFKKILLGVLLLHVIVFSIKFEDEKEEEQPKTPKIKIQMGEYKQGNKKKKEEFVPMNGDEDCEQFYYGVGFQTNLFDKIIEFAPNGTAISSGLLVGDVIVAMDEWNKQDENNVGKTVEVDVMRNGQYNKFKMNIKKICIEDE